MGTGLAPSEGGPMLKSSHLTRIAALAATAAAFAAAPAFAADGDLVSGFADDGRQIGNLGVDDPATAVAVQPDGKVVVVGSVAYGAGDIFVIRYETDGTLDQSF